jgi:hypothetical protein
VLAVIAGRWWTELLRGKEEAPPVVESRSNGRKAAEKEQGGPQEGASTLHFAAP